MEHFLSKSNKIQEILKGFTLTKTLFVSSILIGEPHTGKKTLLQYLFPNTPLVSAENQEEVELTLEKYEEIIITDFEKLSNPTALNFANKRIIATANYMGNASIIDDLFAFIYTMPPLRERLEDISSLKLLFFKEACATLMLQEDSIDIENISIDLTLNNKSLKKSIYVNLTKQTMNESDIEDIIYQYILENLDGNDGYHQYLKLYEKPLIKAGLKKYASQFQLALVLGINRNTLRKKIHEHNID